jgi:hypothetical protein
VSPNLRFPSPREEAREADFLAKSQFLAVLL